MRRLEAFGKMGDTGSPTWFRRRGKGLRATWISIFVICSSSAWHLGATLCLLKVLLWKFQQRQSLLGQRQRAFLWRFFGVWKCSLAMLSTLRCRSRCQNELSQSCGKQRSPGCQFPPHDWKRHVEMLQVKSLNISFIILSSSLGSCFTLEVLEALNPFMKPLSKSLMPLATQCRQTFSK